MKIRLSQMLILLVIACCANQLSGQDSIKTQPKNAIYVHAGTLFADFYASASASYERQVFTTEKKCYINYYVRGTYGAWLNFTDDGSYGTLSLQGVFGPKKAHLELGLGLAAMYNSYYDSIVIAPAGSVGYRYQKPKGGFIFRTGVGFPDGIYISMGYSFL